MPRTCPPVDRFMNDETKRSLVEWELALLRSEHNVNLHSAGEEDDFLDGDDNPYEGLTIIGEEEFFERYVL